MGPSPLGTWYVGNNPLMTPESHHRGLEQPPPTLAKKKPNILVLPPFRCGGWKNYFCFDF